MGGTRIDRGRCKVFEFSAPLGCVLLELCPELLYAAEGLCRDGGQQVLQAALQPLEKIQKERLVPCCKHTNTIEMYR